MPDRVPQQDAELAELLARLALDDLPEPLVRAVVESLEWAVRLDREAASRAGNGATRPR